MNKYVDDILFFMKFQNIKMSNLYFKDCKDELAITSCRASTEFSKSYDCNKAFDGNEYDGWATLNEGVGAWIQLNLDIPYRLTKIMILQRQNEFFKDVLLEFSVGAPATFTLSNGYRWETIELDDNSIFTDYVKITGINVYNKVNNGFAELKVFGCASDTLGMTHLK